MAANVQLRSVDGNTKRANNRGVITDESPLPDVSGNDNEENLDPKAPHSQNSSWCLSLLKQSTIQQTSPADRPHRKSETLGKMKIQRKQGKKAEGEISQLIKAGS